MVVGSGDGEGAFLEIAALCPDVALVDQVLSGLDCACAPGLVQGKKLYPHLAQRFGTTPGAVEKAVRSAIERTWLSGSLPEIQRLFGLSVDAEKGKPTNLECIAMLAEHVRRMLRKAMETKK